jgi:predicted nuclease of restriction endonuclease-like RecB superfamily
MTKIVDHEQALDEFLVVNVQLNLGAIRHQLAEIRANRPEISEAEMDRALSVVLERLCNIEMAAGVLIEERRETKFSPTALPPSATRTVLRRLSHVGVQDEVA